MSNWKDSDGEDYFDEDEMDKYWKSYKGVDYSKNMFSKDSLKYMPFGWGTAFNHHQAKYDDPEGLLPEDEVPSNIEFWENEKESCFKAMKKAIAKGKIADINRTLIEYRVAKNRYEKELAISQ